MTLSSPFLNLDVFSASITSYGNELHKLSSLHGKDHKEHEESFLPGNLVVNSIKLPWSISGLEAGPSQSHKVWIIKELSGALLDNS